MPIRYNKLFNILRENKIKISELQKRANITGSIMARLAKEENVRVDTIEKICKVLKCQPSDIMEYYESKEAINELNGEILIIERIPHYRDETEETIFEKEEYENEFLDLE